MNSFYMSLIEYFRSVCGDDGFECIDIGPSHYSNIIKVRHGNTIYELRIDEKPAEIKEEQE